jgi:hypothetical protein
LFGRESISHSLHTHAELARWRELVQGLA